MFVAQDGRVRTAVSVARIRRRAADGADTLPFALLRSQPRPWPAYDESVSRPHADALQARHQRAYAPQLRVVTENARSRDHVKVTPAVSPALPPRRPRRASTGLVIPVARTRPLSRPPLLTSATRGASPSRRCLFRLAPPVARPPSPSQ